MAIRHSTPADGSFTGAGAAAWNADHTGNASDLSFTQAGTGAVAETVQAALRRLVFSGQYSSTANFNTARDALTDTVGVKARTMRAYLCHLSPCVNTAVKIYDKVISDSL